MLSRIIRGNAALYAEFGGWWIGAVVVVCSVGLYAVASGITGLIVVACLGLAGLIRWACDEVGSITESQAQREAAFLAKHQPVDPALEAARRRFLSEPTIKLVMPNLGEGQEL